MIKPKTSNTFPSKEPTNKQIDSETIDIEEISKIESSALLRKKREEAGLSLKELSIKTKISISVLEAIENGWRHRLPENAYLMKMLKILENELSIKEDSLKGLLHNQEKHNQKKHKVFTPISFEVFGTWKGSLLYFLVILVSILILNKQYLNQLYILDLEKPSLEINSN